MTDIETMIEDAERHGRDSDPDHEVGDLQELARVLWNSLAPSEQKRLAAQWRAWDADVDTDRRRTAMARVERHHFANPFAYRILTGDFAGAHFVASDLAVEDESLLGHEVEVTFLPPDQFARRTVDSVRKICVRCDALITDPQLAASESERCAPCSESMRVRSIEDVRRILAQRAADIIRPGYAGPVTMTCTDGCAGWSVFDTARGLEVQACDECNTLAPDDERLSDDDVAQLPEAQGALGLAQSQCPDCGGEHCPHFACVTGGAHGHCDLCTDEDE